MDSLIRYRNNLLFAGILVATILLFWNIAAHNPIQLDRVILLKSWQWPYRLRFPFTLILVVFTIIGWWKDQEGVAVKFPERWKRIFDSPTLYIALVCITFVTCRWFTLAGNELDLDESQSIVTARTLLRDCRFWISVDIGTHGPFVSLPQAALPYFGIAIDYAGSRLLGALMMLTGILATFVVIRRVAARSTARLLLLPFLFLVAAFEVGDLVAYNGELPILFFMMLSVAAVVSGLYPKWQYRDDGIVNAVPDRKAISYLVLGGVGMGLVPWVKLQGAPLVLVLSFLTVYGCLVAPISAGGSPLNRRALRIGSFFVGMIFPSVAIIAWLIADGAFLPMVRSYILWGIAYSNRNNEPLAQSASRLLPWLQKFLIGCTSLQEDLQPMVIVGVVTAGFLIWLRGKWTRVESFAVLSLLWLLVACVCILKPGNMYDHYLLLAVFPLGLFGMAIWASLLRQSAPLTGIFRFLSPRILGIAFILLGVVYPIGAWGGDWTFFVNDDGRGIRLLLPFRLVRSSYMYGEPLDDQLSKALRDVTHPDEYVAIWGYRPNLFVTSRTLSATRSAVSIREAIREEPYQTYFYELYLHDMDVNRPIVFVDNMNPKDNLFLVYKAIRTNDIHLPLHTAKDFEHENYPELNSRIIRDYHLYLRADTGSRLYVRNDRYAAIKARLLGTKIDLTDKHLKE